MSALKILSRLTAAKSAVQVKIRTRMTSGKSLGVHLNSTLSHSMIASRPFHNTIVRYVSQASKDKVNERNEAIKRDQTIEERVKMIIVEHLDVKEEEVCRRHPTLFFICPLGPVVAEANTVPLLTSWTSKVVNSARFDDDLGADSFNAVEIAMAFEEEFGMDIPDEEAEKLRTGTSLITLGFLSLFSTGG